jgi:hypothetical protein
MSVKVRSAALCDEAYTHIADTVIVLRAAAHELRQSDQGHSPAARAVAIAITHAETAALWISCAQQGGEP